MTIVSQNAIKPGFFVTSVRSPRRSEPEPGNSGEIESVFYYQLCKTNPILSAVGGLQMNVNSLITTDYENISDWTLGQNKPNSNPIKPNFQKAQMNVNFFAKGYYESKPTFAANNPNLEITTAWSRGARIRLSAGLNLGRTQPRCFSFLVLSNFWLSLYIVYCLISPDRLLRLSLVLKWVLFKS
jgi:hypothetical protein